MKQLGGHWLAFLWSLEAGHGDQLKEAVQQAVSAGASVFELIFQALNAMTAKETAKAIKDGGMTNAIECVFFPPGEGGASPPCGDPLSDDDDEFGLAVMNFKQVCAFIFSLRKFGIEIDLIVGPSCFVLGKTYDLSEDELRSSIVRFYKEVAHDLRKMGIRVAIELLREEEDQVVCTVENAIAIVDALNAEIEGDRFGIHYDTFHFDCRGYNQVASIKALGRRITHLHVNGTGRRPAGGDGDKLNWSEICAAVTEHTRVEVATNEPFCALVRANSPELGDGLPEPVDEPGGIQTTADTLRELEFIS